MISNKRILNEVQNIYNVTNTLFTLTGEHTSNIKGLRTVGYRQDKEIKTALSNTGRLGTRIDALNKKVDALLEYLKVEYVVENSLVRKIKK
jgi:hypothetical protein